MKIYLQRITDSAFLLPDGTWGDQPGRALHFPRSPDAVLYAVQHHFSGVQIAMQFDQGERYTMLIPLDEVKGRPRALHEKQ